MKTSSGRHHFCRTLSRCCHEIIRLASLAQNDTEVIARPPWPGCRASLREMPNSATRCLVTPGAQALRHQLDSALGSRCRGLLGHRHPPVSPGASITSTISPRTPPGSSARAANRSRSSAALPRATSSCSFVSSRQTATSRHGSTSAMTESAATSRFGLS